jgi:DNA recombination protein RmuC
MGEDATRNREDLRQLIEAKLQSSATFQMDQAKALREELNGSFHRLGGNVDKTMTDLGAQQKERLDAIAQKLDADIGKMGEEAVRNREGLRQLVETKLESAAAQQGEQAKALREELNGSFHRLGDRQKEGLESATLAIQTLGEKNEKSQEALRLAVEVRLDAIRVESATKLEEMRQTVDEKLQTTLETRLGESFNRVVEQLNRVHEGLGEMKNLASNVGDLRNVLTNVKVRGTFGEVQLELILEQFLTSDQYIKDARVREHSSERVEFAIRFPGKGSGEEVLLPVDAKFPRESYERLIEASEKGEAALIDLHRKQLQAQIRACAKDIRDKYIHPPRTTDFALLFLPTEGLYAEVLRQPGMFEGLQRDYKVTLAGPTTLSAILNAFQMGFRSIAIEKRSSEVWQILSAVQNEFGKYNAVVERLGKQLSTAATSVETLGKRTRAMTRRLKTVEALPEGASGPALLGFDDAELDSGDEEAASAPTISDIFVLADEA